MRARYTLKTAKEIEYLRANNQLVSDTLAFLAPKVLPGVRTLDLDREAETFIRDHGAVPGFKGYDGYEYTLCISVNDVVVHGFPSEYRLQEGDIVSIDCGTYMHSFYGDSAFTFAVGDVSPEVHELLRVTRESLELGISQAVAGKRVGDIGFAVQQHAELHGFGIVREMVGHGLGRKMHEPPMVPNYGRRGTDTLLKAGLVICIEPMVTMGSYAVYQDSDGWGIRTRDHSMAAHFEKAVVVRTEADGGADVLTSFDVIDCALGSVK